MQVTCRTLENGQSVAGRRKAALRRSRLAATTFLVTVSLVLPSYAQEQFIVECREGRFGAERHLIRLDFRFDRDGHAVELFGEEVTVGSEDNGIKSCSLEKVDKIHLRCLQSSIYEYPPIKFEITHTITKDGEYSRYSLCEPNTSGSEGGTDEFLNAARSICSLENPLRSYDCSSSQAIAVLRMVTSTMLEQNVLRID